MLDKIFPGKGFFKIIYEIKNWMSDRQHLKWIFCEEMKFWPARQHVAKCLFIIISIAWIYVLFLQVKKVKMIINKPFRPQITAFWQVAQNYHTTPFFI